MFLFIQQILRTHYVQNIVLDALKNKIGELRESNP